MAAVQQRPPSIISDRRERVSLTFETGPEQFAALTEAGRRLRAERNVVYPPGVWSDEDCARYAVCAAMAEAYPELANGGSQ